VSLAAALGLVSAVIVATRSDPAVPAVEPAAAVDAPDALPASPAPAFAIPRPRPLSASDDATRWAPLLRAVAVRSEPREGAPAIETLELKTPEGTSNLVPVLGRRQGRRGAIWLQVRAPALPDNVEGWVPRASLGGYTLVHTRLVVDLEHLQATLFARGKRVFTAPIGVGKPESPTPRGEFYIRNELRAYSSPFYGPIAFGTSARSPVLTDWPAGGFVGIHGTDRPDLLPGRVSHGCIRLRNTDIVRLARLLPIGTPLTIQ